ncbi:MAG: superoxide dismutase [Calditrichaceae bacterium]
MPLTLPDLPYAKNALEPHISERTLEFHYGKHHQAYVTNGNNMIAGTEFENLPVEVIIKKTADNKDKAGIFNNAAQVWNHSFYWKCMKANGGGKPAGKIADKIKADFGSYEQFLDEFKKAGATQFGSGWAWLVLDNDTLKVVKTANAENPITKNLKPLLVVDVWEHAYYRDDDSGSPDNRQL